MKLDELINVAGDMKVLPTVARKVMEMVEREDISGNQLAEVISKRSGSFSTPLKGCQLCPIWTPARDHDCFDGC